MGYSMIERAHPEDAGFKDKFFGLVKTRYKKKLYERYAVYSFGGWLNWRDTLS